MTTAAQRTMKRHRDEIKALKAEAATFDYRLQSALERLEDERKKHAHTRSTQLGFREGVEFAIAAMIREITHWKGSPS